MISGAIQTVVLTFILIALTLGILYFKKNSEKKLKRLPFDQFPTPAGWSLQQRTNELSDKCTGYFFGIAGLSVIMVYLYQQKTPVLLLVTIALCLYGYIIYQLIKVLQQYANHHLGLLGEQAVGAKLNRINKENFSVYHDFQVTEKNKTSWNIDHIVVCDAGVFLIETKTRRKMQKNVKDGHKVTFTKNTLQFPKHTETDCLTQVTRSAKWLSAHLSKVTGTGISVQPIIVLPGWYVTMSSPKSANSTIITNDTNLARSFMNQSPKLSRETLTQLNYQLDRHCQVNL